MNLAAADSGYGDGLIYTSSDGGSTWAHTSAPVLYWTSLASSADGRRLVASAYPGGVFVWQLIPSLNIALAGQNLTISWQASTNYLLQETSDLASGHWAFVTNVPVLANGLREVVLSLPPASDQFYRLESQ
jgi:hypothetical protein